MQRSMSWQDSLAEESRHTLLGTNLVRGGLLATVELSAIVSTGNDHKHMLCLCYAYAIASHLPITAADMHICSDCYPPYTGVQMKQQN